LLPAAAGIVVDFIGKRHALFEIGNARPLDGGDMDEHVAPATIGRDKPESLIAIEEFDGARLAHVHGLQGAAAFANRPINHDTKL
jgi:hypothetical protein